MARLQHAPERSRRAEFTGRYELTRADYDRTPIKPVVDGEPIYEDHPILFDARKLGQSIASDVRRALYRDLFSGAFGHTCGHHSVWQFWTPARQPINKPLMPWTKAIDQPGAAAMQHARALLESRPFLTRIPADVSSFTREWRPACLARAGIDSWRRATLAARTRWSMHRFDATSLCA